MLQVVSSNTWPIHGLHPGRDSMVAVGDLDEFPSPGCGPGNHRGQGSTITAILAEQCPVNSGYHINQRFGELYQGGCRQADGIAQF